MTAANDPCLTCPDCGCALLMSALTNGTHTAQCSDEHNCRADWIVQGKTRDEAADKFVQKCERFGYTKALDAKIVEIESGADTPLFGPWWRTPKGIVFQYEQCGFNGFQCFATPIGWAQQTAREALKNGPEYLWHEFTIRFADVPDFLRRCEYLGKEEPTALVLAQIERIERLAGHGEKPAPAVVRAQFEQLGLFA